MAGLILRVDNMESVSLAAVPYGGTERFHHARFPEVFKFDPGEMIRIVLEGPYPKEAVEESLEYANGHSIVIQVDSEKNMRDLAAELDTLANNTRARVTDIGEYISESTKRRTYTTKERSRALQNFRSKILGLQENVSDLSEKGLKFINYKINIEK